MILYSLSGDPFHKWHANIAKKAQLETGKEISYLLVQSPEKTPGLLQMHERYADMLITLFSYWVEQGTIQKWNKHDKLVALRNSIHVAKTHGDIVKHMHNADMIVRWYRFEADLEYSLQLLEKLWNPAWIDKALLIEQDPQYRNISSTVYKKAYWVVSTPFPEVYSFLSKESIDAYCKNIWRESDGERHIAAEQEILHYFNLVSDLEKKGWYDKLDFMMKG